MCIALVLLTASCRGQTASVPATSPPVPSVPATSPPVPSISPTARPPLLATATPTLRPERTPTAVATVTLRAPSDFGCLAFQSEGLDIWLWSGGGVPRVLTQGEQPVFSPDGRYLAFYRYFPTEVWLRDLHDGSEARLHVGRPLVYDMAWSPDGKMLALTNGAYGKVVPTGDLWRVDIPDGVVRQLADEGGGSPRFSPDSRWIALVRTYWSPRADVWIMRSDGEQHRMLFDYLISQNLEWARDSSGFALALTRIGAADPWEKELWWVPVEGDPVELGRLADAGNVQWQPGAERLLYIPVSQGESAAVHLANRDGSGDLVVPGSEGMIVTGGYAGGRSVWSPDGRWFLAGNRSGRFYLVDTHNLGAPRPLDVEMVYGWLDAGHYLAGESAGPGVDLCRCAPLGPCEFLARVPGGITAYSYVSGCAR